MRLFDIIIRWFRKLFKTNQNRQVHIDETTQKDQSLTETEKIPQQKQ